MARRRRQTQVWHPEQIKAEVRMRGKTLSQLALEHGCDESVCRAALIRSSPTGERIISTFLNVPLYELWPSRYSKAGARLVGRHVRDEDKQNRVPAHGLIGEAA